MRNSILTALILVTAAARAVAASDDLTIVSKNSQNGKPGVNSTSYLASDHVRMAGDEGHETIVDLKTGVMTTLDGKKKTYYTVTKQDLEQMRVKMQERMNSPEMKKGMEFMQKMGAAVAQSYEVKKAGTSRRIAGFSCEDWIITMGGMSTTHECLTSELQYPAHAFDAYKEFGESMRSTMSGFGPMAKSGAELAEKLKSMKGFPLATSMAMDVMGMKTTTESEVVEVRRGAIPASAWEIPAGYTQIENPMLKAFERQSHAHPSG
jgi:Domain of unknown function (DUF4412)